MKVTLIEKLSLYNALKTHLVGYAPKNLLRTISPKKITLIIFAGKRLKDFICGRQED